MPPALASVIESCLEVQPALRPSVAAVQAALTEALPQLPEGNDAYVAVPRKSKSLRRPTM